MTFFLLLFLFLTYLDVHYTVYRSKLMKAERLKRTFPFSKDSRASSPTMKTPRTTNDISTSSAKNQATASVAATSSNFLISNLKAYQSKSFRPRTPDSTKPSHPNEDDNQSGVTSKEATTPISPPPKSTSIQNHANSSTGTTEHSSSQVG